MKQHKRHSKFTGTAAALLPSAFCCILITNDNLAETLTSQAQRLLVNRMLLSKKEK